MNYIKHLKYCCINDNYSTLCHVCNVGQNIACYGTTHADSMYGDIPCSRNLTQEEIDRWYEKY